MGFTKRDCSVLKQNWTVLSLKKNSSLRNAVNTVKIVDCFAKTRKYISVEETRSANTHEFHPWTVYFSLHKPKTKSVQNWVCKNSVILPPANKSRFMKHPNSTTRAGHSLLQEFGQPKKIRPCNSLEFETVLNFSCNPRHRKFPHQPVKFQSLYRELQIKKLLP